MLPNEPHVTEGRLHLGTHVAQTAPCRVSGRLEQSAGTRRSAAGPRRSPFTSENPTRTPVASSTRGRHSHAQNSVAWDVFPSKRGDVSQRVWRLFVGQLSSPPHSAPSVLSLTPAEALPLIPFHNDARRVQDPDVNNQ